MTDLPYILKSADVAAMPGIHKVHRLNSNAVRINKSLGDATGLTGFGFHIIEVEPGHDAGEYPNKHKRIYRNAGLPWVLVDEDNVEELDGSVGKK